MLSCSFSIKLSEINRMNVQRSSSASQVTQMAKNLSAMQETWIQCLGWVDPLEKGMATHPSIPSWEIPWTEEPSESHSVISNSFRLHGLWNSPGQNPGVGAFPFSRGSSQPRNQAGVSALPMDSLPAEPQGKPKNTGVGSLSLLQQIFLTQESNQGLLHCKQILYQLSYEGSPICIFYHIKKKNDLVNSTMFIKFELQKFRVITKISHLCFEMICFKLEDNVPLAMNIKQEP